jgi:hypothetical protein
MFDKDLINLFNVNEYVEQASRVSRFCEKQKKDLVFLRTQNRVMQTSHLFSLDTDLFHGNQKPFQIMCALIQVIQFV